MKNSICIFCGHAIVSKDSGYTGIRCIGDGVHQFTKTESYGFELNMHQHQHTIPVEWVEVQYLGDIKSKVTKLRCICGDEVDR